MKSVIQSGMHAVSSLLGHSEHKDETTTPEPAASETAGVATTTTTDSLSTRTENLSLGQDDTVKKDIDNQSKSSSQESPKIQSVTEAASKTTTTEQEPHRPTTTLTSQDSSYIIQSQPGGAADPMIDFVNSTSLVTSESQEKDTITTADDTIDVLPTHASPTAALIHEAVVEDKVDVVPSIIDPPLQNPKRKNTLPEAPSPLATIVHEAVHDHKIAVAPAESAHEPTAPGPGVHLGGAATDTIEERVVQSNV